MRRLVFFMLGMLLISSQLLAQNRPITGQVTDPQGNGIPNVTILVKGTNQGTSTTSDGSFSITVPPTAKALVVSSVGFQKTEVPITRSSTYGISLSTVNQDLNEVVVVAYGTIKKGEATASTTQVGYEKFKNRPITNISNILEGSGAGIQTLVANGQPGSSQTVRIRGFGSINASNDPLYVVDGVVYTGGLSNFNMEDVESVSVLKDAASTALYGSRGANGVVIVTTKKGRRNRNQLTFKMSQGVSSRGLPEYDKVNAFQYYPLMWQSLRNSLYYGSGQPLATANTNATNQIKTQLGYNPFNVANTDIVRTDGTLNPDARLLWGDDLNWNKELERQGRRQEYSISYSGANEKTDYYSSFGYVAEKGFIIRSDQNKFMGRLNVNTQALSWFKTGVNLSGTLTNSNQASDGSSTGYVNPFFFTRQMGPIYPVYAHLTTGEYMLDGSAKRFYDYGNMSALGIPNRPSGASAGRHVIAETKLNQSDYNRNIMSGRTYGEVTILKDLKATTNVSLDLTNYYGSTYDNNLVGDGAPAGRASKNEQIIRGITFNQLLNYTKRIKNHNVSVLGGHENYDYKFTNFSASRQNQVVAGNYDLDNFTTTNDVTSQTDKHRIESYFSRLNYDFAGKYNLEGSFRRDGNSRFKKEFRWDNFWSVGGRWNVSQEQFMKSISWLNNLSLRASYGRVGNDAGIGYYPYQALYSLGFNNALEPGIRQSALPNDSIRWEGQKTADFAIEFSALKSRITGSVEYYNRVSDDLIFGVQLPLQLGGYTLNKNIGTLVNRGIEVQLGADVVRGKDVNWKLELNASTLHNEITKMPTNQPEIISGTKKLKVGHSIYDYWLRDWQGVDPTDGSGLYKAATYNSTNSRIRGKEDTVTTSQNNAAYKYAGSAIPDYWGSIQNTISYRRFELSSILTYQVGGLVYDATYGALMHTGTYGTALHVDALRAWKNAGDITDVPRMDNSKAGVFDAASTRWLIDASFLNIRSVSLSYNIPTTFLSKIRSTGARVYIDGENLGWYSKRKGMNVQQSFTGVTSNVYTPSKMVTVGLNVNF